MEIKNARYELTAVYEEQYPQTVIPEVSFVGRSNVGKSSIINSLCNRRNLAKVGATPGKTKTINFFNIDEKFFFVDLPGYGYASVSRTQKGSWSNIVDTYLTTRLQLRLVIMMVDIRHEPSEDDKLMHNWLVECKVPYTIVATKADKIPRGKIKPRLMELKKSLGAVEEIEITAFSSLEKRGIEQILTIVDKFISVEQIKF